MELLEGIWLVFEFAFIVFVAVLWRQVALKQHPLRRYFVPGLLVKLFGALFISVIYAEYYNGGDTLNYYEGAQVLNSYFATDPAGVLETVFFTQGDSATVDYYMGRYWMYRDPSAFVLIKICFLLGFISFQSFYGIALWLGFFSFIGIWKLFVALHKITGLPSKQLAIATLFMPSIVVWGSAIFKDNLTMSAVGFLTANLCLIFYERKHRPQHYIMALFWVYLIVNVKAYIILAYAGPLMVWLLMLLKDRYIKNPVLSATAVPVMMASAAFLAFGAITFLGDMTSQYSLDTIARKAYDTQWWHTKVVELYGEGGGGSYYSLGTPDPSLTGMASKIVPSVVVALFRPTVLEANNVIMLLSALETTAIILFTIWAILRTGLKQVWRVVVEDRFLQFCILFVLILAFGVGFTSYNFGALVRYRIPIWPFYFAVVFSLMQSRRLMQKR